MRSSTCLVLMAGMGLTLGTGAFVPTLQAGGSFAGASHRAGFSQCSAKASGTGVESAGALLRTLRARQSHNRGVVRDSPTITMDTDRAYVSAVKSGDQWSEALATASENGSLLVVIFKKDFCRKCAAMKPKFAQLARDYADRDVMWVEVDGIKLGKELREQLKLTKVPSFQVWEHGRVLEHFDADMDLKKTVNLINTLVNKYAGDEDSVPSDSVLSRDLASRSSNGMSLPADLDAALMERTLQP